MWVPSCTPKHCPQTPQSPVVAAIRPLWPPHLRATPNPPAREGSAAGPTADAAAAIAVAASLLTAHATATNNVVTTAAAMAHTVPTAPAAANSGRSSIRHSSSTAAAFPPTLPTTPAAYNSARGTSASTTAAVAPLPYAAVPCSRTPAARHPRTASVQQGAQGGARGGCFVQVGQGAAEVQGADARRVVAGSQEGCKGVHLGGILKSGLEEGSRCGRTWVQASNQRRVDPVVVVRYLRQRRQREVVRGGWSAECGVRGVG